MAEIPGILRPELQALPQIADRMTFLLFLAHAGVIPSAKCLCTNIRSIPRIRGGDPATTAACISMLTYSPHTRG